MRWIIFPQWNTFNIVTYGLLAMGSILPGFFEFFNLTSLHYGKFRKEGTIRSKISVVVIYSAPLFAHVIYSYWFLNDLNLLQIIFASVIIIHFAKRSLEVLYLHKYSRSIDRLTLFRITIFYIFVVIFAASLNQGTMKEIDLLFVVGFIIFILGEYLNFFHHKLLADLRTASLDYFIPTRGLFRYVSCPHYLAELITWAGIALLSRHLGMYLVFLTMMSYLIARSLKTQMWYRAKFPEYPLHRKAIIPFIL